MVKFFAGIILAGLSASPSGAVEAKVLGIEITATHLVATGIGKAPDTAQSETQRKSLARDAAILSAQTHLLMFVQDLSKGKEKLYEAMNKDKKLTLKVKGSLSRAEVIRTLWNEDGSATAIVRLAKKDIKKIRGLKIP